MMFARLDWKPEELLILSLDLKKNTDSFEEFIDHLSDRGWNITNEEGFKKLYWDASMEELQSKLLRSEYKPCRGCGRWMPIGRYCYRCEITNK